MAEEVDYLETFFLHSIPSLFCQTQQNLHSDNLNALEYFERRLDDHAYVIRSVIIQCEQQRKRRLNSINYLAADHRRDVRAFIIQTELLRRTSARKYR